MEQLERMIEAYADELSEAALLAGLAMIEKGCADARSSIDFRWRSSPRSEVGRLRRRVQLGYALCRFGALVGEADSERWAEFERTNREQAKAEQLLEDLRPRPRKKADARPVKHENASDPSGKEHTP